MCFETGIQNSPLAIAVVLASFPQEVADRMLPIPLLYALLVLVTGSLVTWMLRGVDVVADADADLG